MVKLPSMTKTSTVDNKNTPGTIVLQWLTYAFWGWTTLALWVLTAFSVGYFMSPEGSESAGSGVAYSLAAVIVLFIISTICDILYSKREPVEKTGIATVVMVIHAVIFALFGIGALIVAVFAVVAMLIGEDDNSGAVTTLITGLIVAVVYAATLLRTLRLFKLRHASVLYIGFMVVVSLVVSALGIFGPALYAQQTRSDRMIERGLSGVSRSIRSYAVDNKRLPASLSDVESQLNDSAKSIVNDDLVEYVPGDKYEPAARKTTTGSSENTAYRYELCVTYKAKKNIESNTQLDSTTPTTSPSTYRHEAGRVCYDLITNYR